MTKEKPLTTVYDPKKVEQKWYRFWMENNCFQAPVQREKVPFSIVMPPPNVTGSLHLGHALDNTLQDILTRWRRMQGYNALWLPGTDHAGIATQARVEEDLSKEGLSKYDLGRESFLKRVWDWKERYGDQITEQLKLLGSSCDWSRERFTMDEGCSRAVRKVFVQLYEKSLIYRGKYIINWCPKCHTTISDIEVEHTEQEGALFHLKYPLADGEGHIVVATTRPETMLGDTAVAVHPDDRRYTHLVGKQVVLPLLGRKIPVIADSYVDPDFGSGAVKITPAHDPNDFEIGQRHQLEVIQVIDQDARMAAEAGPYQGMDRYECREKILADLQEQGYMLGHNAHAHAVGHCYRCNTVIEPLVSQQWFVKMKPLAEPAMQAAREGHIRFVPERFTKIYLTWLENIRDWCISRQLWWGHRIPVWYCDACGEIICSMEDPVECTKCKSTELRQDQDVLDTWFSSGLWPFSTLGWPDKSADLEYFYPTSVLVTGRDIIFFWVARMIFMALEFTHEVPFKEVFIHGLILDAQGRKMSKSLGNGVDPLEVIDQYGADTLRFMLVTGNTPGSDLRFRLDRLDAVRNFANKIWNAARFVLLNLVDFKEQKVELDYELEDRWIISRLNNTVGQVTGLLERYEIGEAARVIYEFIWSDFCDWYIEAVKPRLYGRKTPESRLTAQAVLSRVLAAVMQLLHPFMPFITEEIWGHLPGAEGSIMLSQWPLAFEEEKFPEAEEEMSFLMSVIRGIRNIRGEMKIPPDKKAEVIIVVPEMRKRQVLEKNEIHLDNLAKASPVKVSASLIDKPSQAGTAVVAGAEIYMPLAGLIDLDKEIRRLEKELDNVLQDLFRVSKKLANENFLKKAPPEIIAKEKAKGRELDTRKAALQERIKVLSGT